MGAAPSGSPGWPECAFSTWSSASMRMVFTHKRSSSLPLGCPWDIAPSCSVAGKFFSADVILVHLCLQQHFAHGGHHGGRPRQIINGSVQIVQVFDEHGAIHVAPLTT